MGNFLRRPKVAPQYELDEHGEPMAIQLDATASHREIRLVFVVALSVGAFVLLVVVLLFWMDCTFCYRERGYCDHDAECHDYKLSSELLPTHRASLTGLSRELYLSGGVCATAPREEVICSEDSRCTWDPDRVGGAGAGEPCVHNRLWTANEDVVPRAAISNGERCEGRCETDSDCRRGLECFTAEAQLDDAIGNETDRTVPGCGQSSGTGSGKFTYYSAEDRGSASSSCATWDADDGSSSGRNCFQPWGYCGLLAGADNVDLAPGEKACPVLCPTETEVGATGRLHPPSATGVAALLAWLLDVTVLALVCWCAPRGNRQVIVCFRPGATARVADSYTDTTVGYVVSQTAAAGAAPVAVAVAQPQQLVAVARPVLPLCDTLGQRQGP
jgi:hypothetical protein